MNSKVFTIPLSIIQYSYFPQKELKNIAVRDSFVCIGGETGSFGAGIEDAFLLKVDDDEANKIPEFGSIITLILIVTLATISFSRNKLARKTVHHKNSLLGFTPFLIIKHSIKSG